MARRWRKTWLAHIRGDINIPPREKKLETSNRRHAEAIHIIDSLIGGHEELRR